MGGCKGSGVSVLIGDVEGITDDGIMAGSSFQVERCAAHPQMPGVLSALGGNIQLMLISCSHHATLGLSAISAGVIEGVLHVFFILYRSAQDKGIIACSCPDHGLCHSGYYMNPVVSARYQNKQAARHPAEP